MEFGSEADLQSLGLETYSHHKPTFTAETNEFCEINFKSSKPIRFITTLRNADDEKLPTYVFSQRYDNILQFIISFPDSGSYKFQLFARPAEDPAERLPLVYSYLIHVTNADKKVYPFPKQYARWIEDGCRLLKPYVLRTDSPLKAVRFEVDIPKARAAMVEISNKEWNILEKRNDHFYGTFDLDKFRGTGVKVNLAADFDGSETSFSVLLEYVI